MSTVQDLINEVSQKINALETAQALYSRQLSPDFNTFDYINTDELGLSRILATLLDPKGSHAQQETFLKLFIEHCLPTVYKADKWQNFLNNIEETKVLLEVVTSKSNSLRRMDIYLQCQVGDDSYGICIENKPYAADQFEQLKDYADELKNRRLTQWHLVYLNENADIPSEYSINSKDLEALIEESQFSALKFSDLIYWLKACKAECQNYSVIEFLAQLIKFIQKRFMGIEDINMENTVLEVMQQSEENIEASIQISNNVETMKKKLIQKLIQDIKTEFLEKYDNGLYKLDFSSLGKGERYERINLIIQGYDKAYVCFEFDNAGFNSPCLGIKFISIEAVKDYPHIEKVKSVLNTVTVDKVWHSPLWPAGYYFQPQDWKRSSEAWLMINNGQMAGKILKEMDRIFKALDENNCF